jgi:predicted XRE-type DNA-binding protein
MTLPSSSMKKEFSQADRIREELFAVVEKTMEDDGVTQAEIARRVGAQRYNINKIVRKAAPVSLDFLVKIAESLGLELDLKVRRKK